MTKGKIVLVPFPFDDFSGTKVRPAICLTDEIGFYDDIVIAFISSQIPATLNSVIKLHRMVTVPKHLIKRKLGVISAKQKTEIDVKLKALFNLK